MHRQGRQELQHTQTAAHTCAGVHVVFCVLSPGLSFTGECAEKRSLLYCVRRVSDLSHSLCLLVRGTETNSVESDPL